MFECVEILYMYVCVYKCIVMGVYSYKFMQMNVKIRECMSNVCECILNSYICTCVCVCLAHYMM